MMKSYMFLSNTLILDHTLFQLFLNLFSFKHFLHKLSSYNRMDFEVSVLMNDDKLKLADAMT